MTIPNKLYKFRSLANCKDLKIIEDIIENGFYCNSFLNFNDMNEGVFSVNEDNINIDVIEKQKYKICSFSGESALESQLMWGHYANAGMGVVIEVEVNNCKNIKKVVYSGSNKNLTSVEKILTNKTEEWEYEKEYRYLGDKDRIGENDKIMGINKICFGTPYERLTNYSAFKKKHTKLEKYLKLKKRLEKICKDKKITTCDYRFSK